jgi:hypothetical protein
VAVVMVDVRVVKDPNHGSQKPIRTIAGQASNAEF